MMRDASYGSSWLVSLSLIIFPMLSHTHQLKTLRIILKNLADPNKSTDPKYRSIKASKISAKFAPCPSATEYLKAIGFTTIIEEGEEVFKIEHVDISTMEAVIIELNNALEMITPATLGDSAGEEKKVEYDRGSSSISTASTITGKISEKQKARMLMEKKEREEKEEARRARKETEAQIKQGMFL